MKNLTTNKVNFSLLFIRITWNSFRIDVEIQTIDNEEFYLQIKELFGIEEDHPEEIMNKIKELFEISQQKIAEDEKLRNLLNINDENLLESVMKLNENFHQLTDEHDRLVQSKLSIHRYSLSFFLFRRKYSG